MRQAPIRNGDATEQDLIAYVTELEREVANARRYLETCREVVGAEEDEMLLDALRRQRAHAPARAATDRRGRRR